ncbi:substrate-binding domain-containing protein [Kosakonia sp. BYX6]|uniref:Phosphate-binding protein PstS n=1 Tax=Kosakonia calanthes TaxID=3139408 RepID=A0ABZ3BGB5_9ENTR
MKAFQLKGLAAMFAVGMMAITGAASAQTVNGAGATLPQPLYEDLFGLDGTSKDVIGTWTYDGVGSGGGKSRFLTTTNTVNFAGSDSVLTATEFATYNSSQRASWGPLIQIPSVLTSVTLPFKMPANASQTTLNLTRDQVCRIFANQITTWGQILGNTNTTPFVVVYRTEASGTTELLSNFLTSAACSGYNFQKSNLFTTVVANSGGVNSNWIAATGSEGVSNALQTAGRFGYLSPSFAFNPGSATAVATIGGALPTSVQLPASATPPTGTARNNPLNWVPAYVLPTNTAVYPIYGTTNLLVGQCYTGGITSDSVGGAVRDFLTKLNNGSYASQIATHLFISLPASWRTAITDAFLTQSSSLGIGNTSVCNGVGRPL